MIFFWVLAYKDPVSYNFVLDETQTTELNELYNWHVVSVEVTQGIHSEELKLWIQATPK